MYIMGTASKLLMVFLIFHDRPRGIVGASPNKNTFINILVDILEH